MRCSLNALGRIKLQVQRLERRNGGRFNYLATLRYVLPRNAVTMLFPIVYKGKRNDGHRRQDCTMATR